MRRDRRCGFGLGLILLLAGCGFQGSEPRPGIYRAVIETPEGDLPFALELEPGSAGQPGEPLSIFVLDGDRRLTAQRVARVDKVYEVQLPGGRARLTFTAQGRKLSGYVDLVSQRSGTEALQFSAERGAAFRFFPEAATDNADVAGRWSASMVRPEGKTLMLVADLQQSHDLVAGTIRDPDGIQQPVTGQVRGDDVRLSSFDGETALLVIATVNADGDLEGEYWSNLTGSATWTARRSTDAQIDAAADEAVTAL
jgi:hypothetical protein